jgi:large subunit ribosomal protein L35
MPKLKTHKGAKKRFRVSAKGKLLRKQAGKRHLNSHKSGNRKRKLRQTVVETDKMAKKIVKSILGQL